MADEALKELLKEYRDGLARNKDIETELKKAWKQEQRKIKLLLLGAAESGKSTIFKQVKFLFREGFSGPERDGYRRIIHTNCLDCIRALVDGALELEIDIGQELQAHKATVEDAKYLSDEVAASIQALWASEPIQNVMEKRAKLQIPDSTTYFMGHIERMADGSYEPTDEDIVRARVQTQGIVEMGFELDDVEFRLFDVGGQRNQRRKWIHLFDDVRALLFVVGISEYDQVIRENGETNRLHEALEVFKEIINSQHFLQTSCILFFNKNDLFTEKIKHIDLNVCFDDYTGGLDAKEAIKFLERKFFEANTNPDKVIYVHTTTATDPSNMRFVFDAVKDMVLSEHLSTV